MSLSVDQPSSIWPSGQASEGLQVDANILLQSPDLARFVESKALENILNFRGRLEIPDVLFVVPEQQFSISFVDSSYTIENEPTDSCPKFSIEVPRELSKGETLSRFSFSPSSNTVDGALLFTRMVYSLLRAGKGLLYAYGVSDPFEFRINPLSESEERVLLHNAKVFHKLKYIERHFRERFFLPDKISSKQIELIERVFRGITEGEFTARKYEVTFLISPQEDILREIDLREPPYFGPGEFTLNVANKVELFGQQLLVGPITVHIGKAELSDPTSFDLIKEAPDKPIPLRFAILDHQVSFRFEDYARQGEERLIEPLIRFKEELALEEPGELVDLVTQSLTNEVSSDEAIQIAIGWQFYNRLPDRYCPQEPELDQAGKYWLVPICLVYASGKGGQVGELLIDIKTGKIIQATSIEEIRSKGQSLAAKLIDAR